MLLTVPVNSIKIYFPDLRDIIKIVKSRFEVTIYKLD